MTSTGNPDTAPIEQDMTMNKKKNRSMIWRYLPVLFVIISIIVLVTGTQAGAILYAIVFPPTVALPEDVTETRYTGHGYGVDEWVYTSEQTACDIAFFYIAEGGSCNLPLVCTADEDDDNIYSGSAVIECGGTQNFSQFAMRWSALINHRQPAGSTINVIREIFWGGEIPPSMDDVINQIEAEQAQDE